MTDISLDAHLEFAKGLAVEAGIIMKRYFRAEDIGTEWKEDDTPLTVADKMINQLVIDRVKEIYPEHGVIGEEGSCSPERNLVWVCDPIDGTIPFSLGIPGSTFCLALVDEGEVQVAVVFEPFQDRLFTAIRSKGAQLNSKNIHVDKSRDMKNRYFYGADWMRPGQKNVRPAIFEIEKRGARLLSVPSYAFMGALVANGDFFAAFMAYGSPWDAAAISLIAEEAGGRATDLQGNKRKYNEWADGILITNGTLHNEIVEMLKNADTWN